MIFFVWEYLRAPLLIPFGIPTQIFFSDTRRQKRLPAGKAGSLASLNEYFGNRAKVRWTFEPACAEAREKAQAGKQNRVIKRAL